LQNYGICNLGHHRRNCDCWNCLGRCWPRSVAGGSKPCEQPCDCGDSSGHPNILHCPRVRLKYLGPKLQAELESNTCQSRCCECGRAEVPHNPKIFHRERWGKYHDLCLRHCPFLTGLPVLSSNEIYPHHPAQDLCSCVSGILPFLKDT